ncbi:hypothetical protein Cgig2_015766 [Carnegiea gigantea]|uniref:Retrovirus-related Pol polyprotein from transposon TNT 1-94-like beta-barrel domain-containing protein n=1 Tax=Carnegiea gigantea TaxID=171969 RepID=A0A9Q1KH70_9CARY|nr:hypothetical protein Cgig2_015766 [Carnegiea gigantea]
MRGLWEELSVMNDLPGFTSVTDEITNFRQALNKQNEEQKLFQFLNVIGYPSWHPREKNSQRKGGINKLGQLNSNFGSKTHGLGFKAANQVETAEQSVPGLTSQQIEQLLKLFPAPCNSSSVNHSEETDEEIDHSFIGIAVCFHAEKEAIDWVIDTGATHHFTSLLKYFHEITSNNAKSCINLPNGTQVPITYDGNVYMCNGLVLKETLVVPTFKYNLLLVSKLCKDNNCMAISHEDICLFQDCLTRKVNGIGEHREELYYLVNSPLAKVSQ